MKKRLPACFLALVLCLGLTVPAFAVDIEYAISEHIKDTFSIMRNGTVDETKGVYTSSRGILLDLYYDWSAWGPTETTYEVYDENDSWTITNTGSKVISAGGSTDYTLSFGYSQYGDDPWDGTDAMGEIDGSFDPNAYCTRGDAVIYIWKAFDEAGAGGAGVFTDIPAGVESLGGAVNFALASGITNGTSPTTFSPGKVCNRGEIVTFLHRAYVPSARLK